MYSFSTPQEFGMCFKNRLKLCTCVSIEARGHENHTVMCIWSQGRRNQAELHPYFWEGDSFLEPEFEALPDRLKEL